MGSMVIINILFSCQSDPKQEIMDALQEDPQTAILAAEKIEDPIKRTMIITELVEEFPHRTRPLCDALPSTISKERCVRLNQRPHLWKPQKDHLQLNPPPIDQLKENCTLDPHPTTCRTAQAQQFAKQKDVQKAMQACEAIEQTQWKSECYFTISEEISTHIELYRHAIDACDRSRQFAKSCWHHSVMGLAQRAEQHWNDWQWHKEMTTIIDDVWESRDPKMKEELRSHFWAQSIHRHIENSKLQIQNLPAEALPHYRTSKAIHTIRFSQEALQELSKWVDLASNTNIQTSSKPRGFASEMDLWIAIQPPENTVIISYLGNSHRLSHSDPDIDWTIAILEASARLRPLHKILILEGLKHSDPAVQLTAQRLSKLDLKAPPDKQMERK
jgi:hypothetical protein